MIPTHLLARAYVATALALGAVGQVTKWAGVWPWHR